MADPVFQSFTTFYHAAPLHYLPHIFASGALYAADIVSASGIRPRVTAKRRDKMLGLSEYVHLSPYSHFPLLADKIVKGYPHALLAFDAVRVLELPGTALLPYNTKAWHTQAAYAPITDRTEQEHLLKRHLTLGHYPSLEVLAKYGVDFALLLSVTFICETERALIADLMQALEIDKPAEFKVSPALFPRADEYHYSVSTPLGAYFDNCKESKRVLTPPHIAFD